ncbi:hypothetical protein BDW71DRAFT_214971 [Aspergillus fruticulosus]
MLLQLLQSLQSTLNNPMVVYGAIALMFPLSIALAAIIHSGNIHTTRRRLRHLQRLGVSTSNMANQYDTKFDAAEGSAIHGPARIKAIYLHPIKSCGPVEVNRALLTKAGFMYDRCFAFATEIVKKDTVTASKCRFISQRTMPTMSQIKTELWLPRKDSNPHDPLVRAGGSLTSRLETIVHTRNLFAVPHLSFIAPLNVTATQIKEFQIRMKTFGIHDRDARGLDMGNIPSVAVALPKLKKFLGIPEDRNLTLLRCTPDTLARTVRNLAPLKYIGSPAMHGYTDQQPININSLSSVHAVSALLPPENNLCMHSASTWKRHRILPKSADTQPRARVAPTLSVVCRTSRCTMPNVNPNTGIFDADIPPPHKKRGRPQPSTTLVQYRAVESGNKTALGYIGMHCVPEDRSLKEAEEQEAGLYVEVGDEIEVLERGTHLYGSTGNDY